MPSIQATEAKNLFTLFNESQAKPFVIPAYQRAYAWESDEVTDLFNDIKAFNAEEMEKKQIDPNYKDGTYFLGSIFYFTNEKQEREIIDGQQRILSLFLFFRAIYDRLKDLSERKREIKKLLWQTDPISGDIKSPDQILITSNAISDEANQVFRLIIASGHSDGARDDNYSKNYRVLQNLVNDLAKDEVVFENFVYRALYCTIVLPIQADSFETTLELFERINDRGKPLSEPDIFKAKIYERLDESQREVFIDRWKSLEQRVNSNGESMKTLFNQYMWFIRAKNNDRRTGTDLKKYFLDKQSNALIDPNLMMLLDKLVDIICVAKNHRSIDGLEWSWNLEIRKSLDIIWATNGEWWKYPSLVYYLAHFDSPNLTEEYLKFLHKLIALLSRVHVMSNANAIKNPILQVNIASIHSSRPNFPEKEFDRESLRVAFEKGNNLMRTWLSILAYDESEQTELLETGWEIEHIIPSKWQKHFVLQGDQIYLIEEIGNLTPLERSQNLFATNSSFLKKRNFYANSRIAMTRSLAEKDNWSVVDIESRNRELVDKLLQIFDRWDSEY